LGLLVFVFAAAVPTVQAYEMIITDSNCSADIDYYVGGKTTNYEIQARWDISDIPAGKVIKDSLVCYFLTMTGTVDNDATYDRVNSQDWDESISNAAYDGLFTSYHMVSYTWNSTGDQTWSCINITEGLRIDYGSNTYTSYRIEDPDRTVGGSGTVEESSTNIKLGTTASNNYFNFTPRDYSDSTKRPYLWINYTDTPTIPTLDSFQVNGTVIHNKQDMKLTVNHSDAGGDSVTIWVSVYHNFTTGNTYHVNTTYSFANSTQNTTWNYLSGNYTRNTNVTFQVIVGDSDGNSSYSNLSRYIYNNLPTQNIPIFKPFPTDPDQNFTCINQFTSDLDGDDVTNIYNWLVNDTSILLLNMPFDTNTSSTKYKYIRDYSGFGNNGTLGSSDGSTVPTWTPTGKMGGAYNFTASFPTRYINITNSTSITNLYDFSIDLWIYPVNITGVHYILTNYEGGAINNNFTLYINNGGLYSFSNQPNYVSTGSADIAANNWYHIVLVMDDGNSYKLYINGKLNDTDTGIIAGPFFVPTQNLTIGSRISTYGPFHGTIDNLRIWNRTLSAEQVYQLYHEGDVGYPNSTIVAAETTIFENWTCQITPNDRIDDGLTLQNSTYIGTNTPTHDTPVILPVSAASTQNLTCLNMSTADGDGDYVTNIYNWILDNKSLLLLNLPFDTQEESTEYKLIRDYSGLGNNVTNGLSSHPQWTPNGKIGGAYEFSGRLSNSEHMNLSISDSLRNLTNFTLDVWIYPKYVNDANAHYILTNYPGGTVHDNDFLLYIYQGSLASYADTDNFVIANGMTTNIWYHVAVVMDDGNSYKLYLNGKLNYTDMIVTGGPFFNDTENFTIGIRKSLVGAFNGTIDNLRIWNRTLTGEQIYQLYLEGSQGYENSTIVAQETSTMENWTCQVTPNDGRVDGTTKENYTILDSCSIAMGISNTLSDGVNWSVTSLPQTDLAANGNNGTGVSEYNISISASGCTADVYIKADGDLISGSDAIRLGNETFCNSTADSEIEDIGCTELTDAYDSIIADGIGDGDKVYLKFFLSIPSGQPAGSYINNIYLKAVKAGDPP